MKVLYLNPDRGIPVLGDKGASVHVREFTTALAALGHEVLLLCATLGEGNARPPAQVVELPAGNSDTLLNDERVRRGLARSILENRTARRELARLAYERNFGAQVEAILMNLGFRPDLVYERHALFHCAGADIARKFGVPRALEVNAPLIAEQEKFRDLCLKELAIAAERSSYFGADRIIAVSKEVSEYIASCGVPRERIATVPNGVDTSRFRPDAGGEAVRARLGLGADPVIGFIGSFKPWHGVDFLVDAFAAMASQNLTLRLLCVGEGPELESARRATAARGLNGRTVFTGRIPHIEIPAYLAAMDISVAPYLPNQDFYFSPLKVVESMAAGTPVIAPRVGQLEMLIEDGETGILFASGDRDDFVEKTLSLVGDVPRRRRMSTVARARALSLFSWEQAVGKILRGVGEHQKAVCST